MKLQANVETDHMICTIVHVRDMRYLVPYQEKSAAVEIYHITLFSYLQAWC